MRPSGRMCPFFTKKSFMGCSFIHFTTAGFDGLGRRAFYQSGSRSPLCMSEIAAQRHAPSRPPPHLRQCCWRPWFYELVSETTWAFYTGRHAGPLAFEDTALMATADRVSAEIARLLDRGTMVKRPKETIASLGGWRPPRFDMYIGTQSMKLLQQ